MSTLPVVLALVIVVPALLWASRASKKRATPRTATIGACVNVLLPFAAVTGIFRLSHYHLIPLPWVGFVLLVALGAWYFISMMWVFGVRASVERARH